MGVFGFKLSGGVAAKFCLMYLFEKLVSYLILKFNLFVLRDSLIFFYFNLKIKKQQQKCPKTSLPVSTSKKLYKHNPNA